MNKLEIIYNEYIEKYVAIIYDEDEGGETHMETLRKDNVDNFIEKMEEAYPNIKIVRMD